MKTKMSEKRSLLLSLLLIPVLSFSLMAQDAMKDINKSFDVSRGMTLQADVHYSDVEILSWEKDVVDIHAQIEVEASSKNKAEEKLSKIDVKMGKNGNTIYLKTDFEEGWSKGAKVDINIVVKAPSYMNLSMDANYGDVFIQELGGQVLLDLKYGNLKVGNLGRGNEKPYNSIELGYSNADIEQAGWLELDLAYSDMEIGISSMLFVESKYSKLLGEKTGGIVTEGAYDKYIFDEVDNMVAELRYSGIKFGKLNKKLTVESKYTGIKIDEVAADFKEIVISASYGNVQLGTEQGASYKLDAQNRYGNITVPFNEGMNKVKDNNSIHIWGNVGSSPKGSMNIENRYGNITVE